MENLLRNLVSYNTTTGNFKEVNNLLSFINSYLNKTPYKCQIYSRNDFSSLLISNCDSKDYDIFFNGHIDVVAANKNQFELIKDNSCYYGRGVFDMKGQVAAILSALKTIPTSKKIGFLITSDEEIGGFNGTGYFIESNPDFKAKLVVVPDGGSNFDLIYSEKGVFQLNITVKGKRAHSAYLYKGLNAIEKGFKIVREIKKLSVAEDLYKFKQDKTTVNLASVNSGDNIYNQVPDTVNMKLDIRYNEHFKKEKILEYLNNLKEKEEIEYFIYAEGTNFYTDPESVIIKNYINIVESIIKRKVKIKTCNSASDARFFSRLKIPTVIMNPLGFEMHGNNERVNIKSLNQLKKIYEMLIGDNYEFNL